MTRDLHEIKQGLAQVRAALSLLEEFIAEYETRSANILPAEDVKFYTASDEDIISGEGVGTLSSINQAIHRAAEDLTVG